MNISSNLIDSTFFKTKGVEIILKFQCADYSFLVHVARFLLASFAPDRIHETVIIT